MTKSLSAGVLDGKGRTDLVALPRRRATFDAIEAIQDQIRRGNLRPGQSLPSERELSEALGCEPPSVTLMTGKLEASGHIRRKPAPSDKRASIVELTDSGKALADQVKQLWCALAEETVTGLPAQTVAELPGVLKTLTGNVDTRRPRHPHGRRDGG